MILGGEEFVLKIQNLIEEKKDIYEIPKLQRYPGRPPLAVILPQKASDKKELRNKLICKAHLEYAYTLKEIGDFLGIHYSTVSRVIKAQSMYYFKT